MHRIGVGRLDGRVKSADGNKTLPTIRATITALHHSPESATAGLNVHVARRAGRAEMKLDAQMLGSYCDRLPWLQLSHTRGSGSSISIDSFIRIACDFILHEMMQINRSGELLRNLLWTANLKKIT